MGDGIAAKWQGDWVYDIIVMSFFWGTVTGALVGVYFAEKSAPFPLSYRSRGDNSAGEIVLDLQIANTIVSDIRGAFGYGPVVQSPPATPK